MAQFSFRLVQLQMPSNIQLEKVVPTKFAGSRFDQIAAELFPDYSRARIKQWITCGDLTADGIVLKANRKLSGGERLILNTELEDSGEWQAEDIPLDIVYEDNSIIVLNKSPGLVVHPAAGNWVGTLLNGLLYRYPELGAVPRAGIVHRLDKDTSGLMVVARTIEAQNHLVKQLQNRTVKREYDAVVFGIPHPNGTVDANIGRHPKLRTRMAVLGLDGKPAITHYEVQQALNDWVCLVRCRLETGRTHQIRVHMTHIGFPLLGDSVYKTSTKALKLPEPLVNIAESFPRQALHAARLGLIHPETEAHCEWSIPLANDIAELINACRLV